MGFTPATLVSHLETTQKQYQLERTLTQFDKTDLLICDELGYVSFSRSSAELLFQVFTERYERKSLLLTSNLPFSCQRSLLLLKTAERSDQASASFALFRQIHFIAAIVFQLRLRLFDEPSHIETAGQLMAPGGSLDRLRKAVGRGIGSGQR